MSTLHSEYYNYNENESKLSPRSMNSQMSIRYTNLTDLKQIRANSKTKKDRELSAEKLEKSFEKLDNLVHNWQTIKNQSNMIQLIEKQKGKKYESPRECIVQRKSIDLENKRLFKQNNGPQQLSWNNFSSYNLNKSYNSDNFLSQQNLSFSKSPHRIRDTSPIVMPSKGDTDQEMINFQQENLPHFPYSSPVSARNNKKPVHKTLSDKKQYIKSNKIQVNKTELESAEKRLDSQFSYHTPGKYINSKSGQNTFSISNQKNNPPNSENSNANNNNNNSYYNNNIANNTTLNLTLNHSNFTYKQQPNQQQQQQQNYYSTQSTQQSAQKQNNSNRKPQYEGIHASGISQPGQSELFPGQPLSNFNSYQFSTIFQPQQQLTQVTDNSVSSFIGVDSLRQQQQNIFNYDIKNMANSNNHSYSSLTSSMVQQQPFLNCYDGQENNSQQQLQQPTKTPYQEYQEQLKMQQQQKNIQNKASKNSPYKVVTQKKLNEKAVNRVEVSLRMQQKKQFNKKAGSYSQHKNTQNQNMEYGSKKKLSLPANSLNSSTGSISTKQQINKYQIQQYSYNPQQVPYQTNLFQENGDESKMRSYSNQALGANNNNNKQLSIDLTSNPPPPLIQEPQNPPLINAVKHNQTHSNNKTLNQQSISPNLNNSFNNNNQLSSASQSVKSSAFSTQQTFKYDNNEISHFQINTGSQLTLLPNNNINQQNSQQNNTGYNNYNQNTKNIDLNMIGNALLGYNTIKSSSQNQQNNNHNQQQTVFTQINLQDELESCQGSKNHKSTVASNSNLPSTPTGQRKTQNKALDITPDSRNTVWAKKALKIQNIQQKPNNKNSILPNKSPLSPKYLPKDLGMFKQPGLKQHVSTSSMVSQDNTPNGLQQEKQQEKSQQQSYSSPQQQSSQRDQQNGQLDAQSLIHQIYKKNGLITDSQIKKSLPRSSFQPNSSQNSTSQQQTDKNKVKKGVTKIVKNLMQLKEETKKLFNQQQQNTNVNGEMSATNNELFDKLYNEIVQKIEKQEE